MQVNKARFAFVLLLLGIIVLFIGTALTYDPKARMIPLIIGLASLVLIIPLLINEVRPLAFVKKLEIDLLENYASGSESACSQPQGPAGLGKLIRLFSWIVGFFVVIFFLGFHIGVAAFTFAYLKFEGRSRLSVSIAAAVVTWGTIYLMFEYAMGFRLFRGLFFGEIVPHI